MAIPLYIQDECSYEQHHLQADRIYRVIKEIKLPNGSRYVSGTSGALTPALLESFPEVQHAMRLIGPIGRDGSYIRYKDKGFYQAFCLADADILNIFTLPLLKGDPTNVLREPYSIILT